MKMNKNLFHLINSLMIILFVFIIIHSVIYFYPFKTIDMLQPFQIMNSSKEIKKGDIVFIKMDYYKYIDSPATTTKYLIGENMYGGQVTISVASTITDNTKGKHVLISGTVIPYAVPHGEYKMVYLIVYELFGGFKKITRTFESDFFRVID